MTIPDNSMASYFGLILGIYVEYSKVILGGNFSWHFFGKIWAAYLGHSFCIYYAYLGHLRRASFAFLGHITYIFDSYHMGLKWVML